MSDPGEILASPLTVIERTGEADDVEKIVGLINHHQAREVIVGLPLSLRGEVGEQAEKVHIFINHLIQHTDVLVEFRDERMTTVSAKRLMRERSSKKVKKKESDDAFAATLILQSYLDEVR